MSDLLAPLAQLDSELTALMDTLAMCTDELRPELEERIAAYVQAETQKIDRIGGVLAALEAVQANAKSEIARLHERQRAAERSAGRLEQYILRILCGRDGRPLKGRHTTFSTRTTEVVVIDDLNQIPDQFKRVTVTTDVPKTPVRDAIKSGTSVPGARLEQHEHLVRR